MKNVIRDVIAQGSLASFTELLSEWTRVVEQFVDAWHPDDVPWWYNERASVSVFAAAVWRSGGMAFEEFSSEKQRRRKKTTYAGKIDLRFSYRAEAFVAEAKQSWPAIGRQAHSAEDEIETKLRRAGKDVRRAPDDEGRRLAVVFSSPSFPMTAKDFARRLERWLLVFKQVDAEAKAFFWLRNCAWTKDQVEGYVYPGAAIFIKEISKAP